jgi:hypothetical protein
LTLHLLHAVIEVVQRTFNHIKLRANITQQASNYCGCTLLRRQILPIVLLIDLMLPPPRQRQQQASSFV